MTNQIEFIINHIASQPDYIDSTGLFKAFQENQEKWAEVEAGIYNEYIRGEGMLSPITQKLKWDQEQHRYKESQDKDQHDSYHPNTTTNPSNLKQPPQSIKQMQPYEAPETTTINLSRSTNTPSPPQILDVNTPLTQKKCNPTPSNKHRIQKKNVLNY